MLDTCVGRAANNKGHVFGCEPCKLPITLLREQLWKVSIAKNKALTQLLLAWTAAVSHVRLQTHAVIKRNWINRLKIGLCLMMCPCNKVNFELLQLYFFSVVFEDFNLTVRQSCSPLASNEQWQVVTKWVAECQVTANNSESNLVKCHLCLHPSSNLVSSSFLLLCVGIHGDTY